MVSITKLIVFCSNFSSNKTALLLLLMLINVSHNTSVAIAQDQFTQPIQISIGEEGNEFASNYQISPDGKHVIYQVNENLVNSLYSVPIEGGISVRLDTGLALNGNVFNDFQISPDSQNVTFRALNNQTEESSIELFNAPIEGGIAPVRLNADLVEGGIVSSFKVSPDSNRIVYFADQNIDNVDELFSVPINGGIPIRLNTNLIPGASVVDFNFEISPDSQRVVYIADQNTDNVFELFSVSINGGTPVRLNPDLVLGGDLSFAGIQISSDSLKVVYLADQNTDGVNELFSVPIKGGTPVKLNADLISGGSVSNIFQISPNDQRVIYLADQNIDSVNELFSVPIDGGTPVRLNSDLTTGGNVVANLNSGFIVSANSQYVVFLADQNTDQIFELFSAPIDGGEAIQLSGNSAENDENQGLFLGDFQVSPDSKRVVYYSNLNADGVDKLFSVPIKGGAALRLNESLISNVIIFRFRFEISPDSQRVVFLANQGSQSILDSRDLYSVPITGGNISLINDDELAFTGDVSIFEISSDSEQIVYLENGSFGSTNERVIYSVAVKPLEELCFSIPASNKNVVTVCL